MTLALYTFADEAYVPAIAALVNSARQTGFTGDIHVGSPEPLSISSQKPARVIFHTLGPSEYWPGNRKAELLLKHPSERFVFLDADMIVTDPTFFPRLENWLDAAPVFAVESVISAIDYRRHSWARRLGRPARSRYWPNHYFNSGLFACDFRRDQSLIEDWDSSMRSALAAPGALFTDVDFPFSDQDILNAVLQDADPQPIGIGPPDIWSAATPNHPFFPIGTFRPPAVLHCTGFEKSWKLRQAPRRLPHAYDLAWYDAVVRKNEPINWEVSFSTTLHGWFERNKFMRMVSFARIALRLLSAS